MLLSWARVASALQARASRRVTGVGRRAAVALVLREGAGGLELLFIRRADDPRDPWSGQIAFPGGRSEPRDADLKATAIRETLEETSVDLLRCGRFVGALDEVRAMARAQPFDLGISPFVFALTAQAEALPGHEVGSVHWVSLERLTLGSARSTAVQGAAGGGEFPCLKVEGLVIWGLTYRIFSDFQERLEIGGTSPRATE